MTYPHVDQIVRLAQKHPEWSPRVETLRATTPVFTDESGRRATVLQWVARGLCACFVLVAAAIAFTMVTHVPLPGLDGAGAIDHG